MRRGGILSLDVLGYLALSAIAITAAALLVNTQLVRMRTTAYTDAMVRAILASHDHASLIAPGLTSSLTDLEDITAMLEEDRDIPRSQLEGGALTANGIDDIYGGNITMEVRSQAYVSTSTPTPTPPSGQVLGPFLKVDADFSGHPDADLCRALAMRIFSPAFPLYRALERDPADVDSNALVVRPREDPARDVGVRGGRLVRDGDNYLDDFQTAFNVRCPRSSATGRGFAVWLQL